MEQLVVLMFSAVVDVGGLGGESGLYVLLEPGGLASGVAELFDVLPEAAGVVCDVHDQQVVFAPVEAGLIGVIRIHH